MLIFVAILSYRIKLMYRFILIQRQFISVRRYVKICSEMRSWMICTKENCSLGVFNGRCYHILSRKHKCAFTLGIRYVQICITFGLKQAYSSSRNRCVLDLVRSWHQSVDVLSDDEDFVSPINCYLFLQIQAWLKTAPNVQQQ